MLKPGPLPITLRPDISSTLPAALVCVAVCAFILATWGNGPVLTSLIGLVLFSSIPFQTAIALMNAEKIFLKLDEVGFTISHVNKCETVQWDWVERFMVVKGAKSRRWVGWRYAPHYPPPHRRKRSTRYLVADEVLLSRYGTRPQALVDLLNHLHGEFRSAKPQQTILRPALAQMLSTATALPVTLYPNKRSLLSSVVAAVGLGVGACYLLSTQPIFLLIVIFLLGVASIRLLQEMSSGTTYLRLDEEGFTHCTPQGKQFVRWHEVERFFAFDHSEYIGWRYVTTSDQKRKKRLIFETDKLDDMLTRVYGDRPEDLASLLNHVLAVQTQRPHS